jgi:molecular chaperone DnaJ
MKRDYYEVLGVAKNADLNQIKSAYRKLALQYHPDKNPGNQEAEEKFKEAAEAYAVVSDNDKRARYDRFGHQATQGGAAGFDPTIFADFSDIFGNLGDIFGFGGSRPGGRRPGRGADLRYDLALTFEEGAFGANKVLRIPRLEHCESCSGSGSAGGKAPKTCSACGGRGQVRYNHGFFTVARPCPQCQGEGVVINDPCPSCKGQGQVEKQREIEVKIPAGVDTGSRMRLNSEGEHGRFGGPPGDLYVVLSVKAHVRFKRDGADVLNEVDVTYAQAVLGGNVEIETIHGKEKVEVPAGTQYGHQFRLRGKGIERLDRPGKGDHLARVRIAVPRLKDLKDDQVELLRQLAELEGSVVKEDKGVLGMVKDLFG